MKFRLLFLFSLVGCLGQAQLPCFRSGTSVLAYSINGKPAADSWRVLPEVKPDILRFGAVQKRNRVVFYADTDSFVCMVRRGENGFRQMMLFVCSTEGREPDVPEKTWEGLMTRISFTEMDHNYVNPVSDGYLSRINKAFRNRAFWADQDRTAGYESAYAVFNEYLTWAAFTLYAREHYDAATFEAVKTWTERQMTDWRGFIRFREFNRKVEELYQKRPAGKKLYELYPDILQWAEGAGH